MILLLYGLKHYCKFEYHLNDHPPSPRVINHLVNVGSSPNDPVFLGPDMNIPPEYVDPDAFWYTQ